MSDITFDNIYVEEVFKIKGDERARVKLSATSWAYTDDVVYNKPDNVQRITVPLASVRVGDKFSYEEVEYTKVKYISMDKYNAHGLDNNNRVHIFPPSTLVIAGEGVNKE